MANRVYCGWCGEQGHNRRTCEGEIDWLHTEAKKEVEGNQALDRDPHTLHQHKYAKKIKANKLLDGTPVDYGKRSGNKMSNRRCSYCGLKGHDRRTCHTLKRNIQVELKSACEYRKEMFDTLINMGLGVGSLVTINPMYGERNPQRNYLYMVKRIRWDLANHITGNDGGRIVEVECMDEDSYNEHIPLPIPESCVFDDSNESWDKPHHQTMQYWSNIKLVAPVSGDAVKSNIPNDWCEITNEDLKDNFKYRYREKTADDYWENYYS